MNSNNVIVQPMEPKNASAERDLVVHTTKELQELFENTSDHVCGLMVRLVFGAGLRLNEICSLQVKGLDFENLIISLLRPSGRRHKTLLPNALKYELLRECAQKRPDDFVFSLRQTSEGRTIPVSKRTLQNYLHKKAREHEMRVTVQSLRDSFIVHLLSNGVDGGYLRHMLGYRHERSLSRYVKYAQARGIIIESPLNKLL